MEHRPSHPELARLIDIVARLRAPDGCPWDRAQTESSMAPHLLEEACEAVDALGAADPAASREELGDVLMNVLMIAQIASEAGRFGIEDVARGIADKLIRRHPHVFGTESERAADAGAALSRWEAAKRAERAQGKTSALAGLPAELPALLRAHRVGEKAARLGFDWPDPRGARAKLDEELAELDQALAAKDADAVARELGDVLFSAVNVARHAGVNPEMALRAAVARFVRRFAYIERELQGQPAGATLETMEALWQQAKARDDD